MKWIMVVCVSMIVTVSCNVRLAEEGFNTYFWASTEGVKMYLYIDGQNKGEVPYRSVAPDCGNDSSKRALVNVYLPSGSYTIEIRDEKGTRLFSETLKVRKSGANISIGTTKSVEDGGGSRRTFKDNCLIEEIFYESR